MRVGATLGIELSPPPEECFPRLKLIQLDMLASPRSDGPQRSAGGVEQARCGIASGLLFSSPHRQGRPSVSSRLLPISSANRLDFFRDGVAQRNSDPRSREDVNPQSLCVAEPVVGALDLGEHDLALVCIVASSRRRPP